MYSAWFCLRHMSSFAIRARKGLVSSSWVVTFALARSNFAFGNNESEHIYANFSHYVRLVVVDPTVFVVAVAVLFNSKLFGQVNLIKLNIQHTPQRSLLLLLLLLLYRSLSTPPSCLTLWHLCRLILLILINISPENPAICTRSLSSN